MTKDNNWNYEEEEAREGICDIAPSSKFSKEVLADGTFTRCIYCNGTARKSSKLGKGFKCGSCGISFTDEDVLRARAATKEEENKTKDS